MKSNKIIENDTKEIINSEFINWEELKNKTIMITGATGLIGAKLITSFLAAKKNIKIIALARSKERLENLFQKEISQ